MTRSIFFQGNPTIFIESTVHAREWITVATTTYFLNELLTSKNASIVYLAQNFDWVIVPVFNVDGYEYTHTTVREKPLVPRLYLYDKLLSILGPGVA